jgi:hypothetical protein
MTTKDDMRGAGPPPATADFARLVDWLALLMLLVGSVVWPR